MPPPPRPSGTTRSQLADKGDKGAYTDFANILVAFAFLGIPVIGWLLDKKVLGQRGGCREASPELLHSLAVAGLAAICFEQQRSNDASR